MDLRSKKLKIIIDIYRIEDIDNKTISDVGDSINRLFQAGRNNSEYTTLREVLMSDDVIGKTDKGK